MKFRFAIFFISCFTANMHGQSYPFPTEAAEWHTTHVSSHCTGGSSRHYYWTEFMGGDTLINDIPYTNLMLWPRCIYIDAGNNCPEEFRYPDDGINAVGGIREVNSQVLFLKYNVPDSLFSEYEIGLGRIPGGEEILLFDYNWIIGDSVLYPNDASEIIFDIIGSNVVNGRKGFGLHRRGFQAWHSFGTVEGMGGTRGLFNMYYADQTASDYHAEDVCFIDNGEIIQAGVRCTFECEVVSTNDLVHEQLRLYPNPTADEFVIGSSTDSKPSVVRLYNPFGQLLYSDNYFEPNESISTEKFGFNGWLYVVRIDFNGQISTGKLLVH